MSELAFDKEGNPFRFSRRTQKLRPRRWKNAGQRGTCAAVLDPDGEQLFIDADAEYAEFRVAVGNVPGFYRLDQCDEDGAPIEDTPPAYVSIEPTRNAAPAGGIDSRDALIRDLAQINAEMTRTIVERFSNVMQAAADVLRAADGAGLPRREPLPPVPVRDEEEDDDEDDDEDDEGGDGGQAEVGHGPQVPHPSAMVWASVEPMLPAIGAWIASTIAKRFSPQSPAVTQPPSPAPTTPAPTPEVAPSAASATDGAAAAPSATPAADGAAAAPSATPAADGVAAGPSGPPAAGGVGVAAAPNAPEPVAAGPGAPELAAAGLSAPEPITPSTATAPHIPAPATAAAASSPPPAATTSGIPPLAGAPPSTTAITGPVPTQPVQADDPRNASPALEPTPEQWAHLFAIRARLSPREAAVVETAVVRMTPEMRAQWLAELSALSIDQATEVVRSMIPKARPKPPAARSGHSDDLKNGEG